MKGVRTGMDWPSDWRKHPYDSRTGYEDPTRFEWQAHQAIEPAMNDYINGLIPSVSALNNTILDEIQYGLKKDKTNPHLPEMRHHNDEIWQRTFGPKF